MQKDIAAYRAALFAPLNTLYFTDQETTSPNDASTTKAAINKEVLFEDHFRLWLYQTKKTTALGLWFMATQNGLLVQRNETNPLPKEPLNCPPDIIHIINHYLFSDLNLRYLF